MRLEEIEHNCWEHEAGWELENQGSKVRERAWHQTVKVTWVGSNKQGLEIGSHALLSPPQTHVWFAVACLGV